MTILFFTEFADVGTTAPGFAIRSLALARHLSQMGLSIAVLTPEIVPASRASDGLRWLAFAPRKVRRGSEWGPWSILRFDFESARVFFGVLRRENPEAVIAALHDPLLAFLIMIASRIVCGTVVFDVHDSWLVLEKEHSGRWKNKFRKVLERAAMLVATKVTTVTPTLKQMISRSYRIPSGKIKVVFSGAELTSATRLQQRNLERDVDLLHLGGPRPYYDTETFLDALSILEGQGFSCSTVFLGFGDDSYLRRVKKRVDTLGLASHVVFLPSVRQNEVSNWLARTKAGVHTLAPDPTYRCAIGIKIFEYLANGVPILHLGPPDGETAELIARTGSGVCASDALGMAEAIRRTLSDSAGLARMSSNARHAALQFSWESSALNMAEALGFAKEAPLS